MKRECEQRVPRKSKTTSLPVGKIISGGQTGVDRAALDAAITLRIPHGGHCPRGRLAEDGVIPRRYRLIETNSVAYRIRTERNVKNSDATLVILRSRPDRGTKLTISLARRHRKACLVINLAAVRRREALQRVRSWLRRHGVRILNVAGSRESRSLGIHQAAASFLLRLLRRRVQKKRRIAKARRNGVKRRGEP